MDGPLAYETWKWYESGGKPDWTLEYALISDAHITGELDSGLGPFQVINGLLGFPPPGGGPAAWLRVELPHLSSPPPETWETDTKRYHGGSLEDEIGALLSLSLGIRIKVHGPTRRFEPDSYPMGLPFPSSSREVPTVPTSLSSSSRIIPNARRSVLLNDTPELQRLCELNPEEARALIISARSYQNALWNAEGDPALAWLQLVTAVECASILWDTTLKSPIEKLKASKPDLYKLLMGKDPDLAQQVAEMLVPVIGGTSKFCRFLLEFLPVEPTPRTGKWAQVRWTKKSLKKDFSKIYDYRSRALHAGIPFPNPLCEPPFFDDEGIAEVPLGLGAKAYGGTWMKEDLPMLLHVFEYVVRGAIMNWWRSLLPEK